MPEQDLKIGIIGLSPGNGHPYSWSTIFNGYAPDVMAGSDFPNITNYLKKQSFPEDQITGASVTHIWTQDKELSRHIADSCFISTVVDDYTDLIGQVDAVLLARDDHETHLEMAKPFLETGIPIFIDKPLAVSVAEAEKIYALEQYEGQLFTCTALRYAKELLPGDMAGIQNISATTAKSWDKYAIHIIEPVLSAIGSEIEITALSRKKEGSAITLNVTWANGITADFTALGPEVKEGGITITYTGEKGTTEQKAQDAFAAFKAALLEFLRTVETRQRVIPKEETLKVIRLIEEGLKDEQSQSQENHAA